MGSSFSFGNNYNSVKEHNTRAILLNLLKNEPAYRARLAEETQLSPTTIGNIVDELLRTGIVVEDGVVEIPGRRKVGRPLSGLRLANGARHVIGIDISIETYRIALADLKANISQYSDHSFPLGEPADITLSRMADHVEDLISSSKIDRSTIIGVGVGAIGLVNYKSGVNKLSPRLGWLDVPIRDRLEAALNLPVIVDNNVKAMALGESVFGLGQDVSSLIFIYSRVGLGAGLVVGSRILRGNDLAAGEIGHTFITTTNPLPCNCGKTGCLETLVSEHAIVQEAHRISEQHPDTILAKYMAESTLGRPAERLYSAAREGDALALTIINRSANFLGLALANLVNVLNPVMIILGGTYAQAQDLFLPAIRQTIEESSFAWLGKKVQVQAAKFGWQAGIVGAVTLALMTYFYKTAEDI